MTDTVTLFTLPYAGGSASSVYNSWTGSLYPTVRVVPLEVAGRGRRMAEPLCDSIDAIADDLVRVVIGHEKLYPYAFYGHSMGSLLIYELCARLQIAGVAPPKWLFLSGMRAPHIVSQRSPISDLPDPLFLQCIRKMGGTPDCFFESRELQALFVPILRSDYRNVEQYRPPESKVIMTSNITYFFSSNDEFLSKTDAQEWQQYTRGHFRLHEYSGGHFFINEHREAICREIARDLAQESSRTLSAKQGAGYG